MSGCGLHQALRSLCYNTDWNYAVFWKLKHRTRMMLSWEDAYCDNHEQNDPSGRKWFNDMEGNLHDRHYSHDLLGLAVAKMSYHVYSLGEGIVGHVAVTGKHMWISGDKHVTESCSLHERCDGWQTQFSAGIRTIAVVAVVPHGVVQIGSLNTIPEDLKLVNYIRNIFFELQSSLVGHISSVLPRSVDCSPCLSDVSTRSSDSGNFCDCVNNLDKTMDKNRTNILPTMLPSFGKPGDWSYLVELHGGYPRKTVEMIDNNQGHEYSVTDRKCEGEASGLRGGDVGSKDNDNPSHDLLSNKTNSYNSCGLPADNFGVDISYSLSDLLNSSPCNDRNGVLSVPEPSNVQMLKDSEMNLEFQKEINNMDTLKTSFEFPAGCELYEALGPAFRKQDSYCDWETEMTETETVIEMAKEGTSSSNLLSTNSGSEHLLEAVVANVCHSGSDDKGAKSFIKSVQTDGSQCYSFERSSLIEEGSLLWSSQGFSSTSHSRSCERLVRPQEPGKVNKKRARPGENCRPRPRDRQLIQDRIKELRELVPNGSKCSIDSLLEHTIKHMLFMQCITKHADKIEKCAESKLLEKETGMRGSSGHEQGSSWAMEVGNNLKVCPIIVENIGMDGQMLVEMLCEECIHFLEIAEAIRNLGLTILKGVTEAYGDKTWICFVVEGQNNRSLHRTDILWSLVQILQSKTKT